MIKNIVREFKAQIRFRHPVMKSLLGSTVLAIIYILFLAFTHKDKVENYAPYVSVFILSIVLATSICCNALALDAPMVKDLLKNKRPLGEILVIKNCALMMVILPSTIAISIAVGILLNSLLAGIQAIFVSLSFTLIWFFIGNIYSVLLPIKRTKLKTLLKDKYLRKRFILINLSSLVIWYLAMGTLILFMDLAKFSYRGSSLALVWVIVLTIPALSLWYLSILFANYSYKKSLRVKNVLISSLDNK